MIITISQSISDISLKHISQAVTKITVTHKPAHLSESYQFLSHTFAHTSLNQSTIGVLWTARIRPSLLSTALVRPYLEKCVQILSEPNRSTVCVPDQIAREVV